MLCCFGFRNEESYAQKSNTSRLTFHISLKLLLMAANNLRLQLTKLISNFFHLVLTNKSVFFSSHKLNLNRIGKTPLHKLIGTQNIETKETTKLTDCRQHCQRVQESSSKVPIVIVYDSGRQLMCGNRNGASRW